MQFDNKMLDDMAKMASSAAGGMLEMKRELEVMVGHQLEKLLQKMNLATREEVDALHGMLAKSREEQEKMKEQIKMLESSVKMTKNDD